MNKAVYFENENRTNIYAIGYDNKEQAESAMDEFLAGVGEEWGRDAIVHENTDEEGYLYWSARVSVADVLKIKTNGSSLSQIIKSAK